MENLLNFLIKLLRSQKNLEENIEPVNQTATNISLSSEESSINEVNETLNNSVILFLTVKLVFKLFVMKKINFMLVIYAIFNRIE
jgi:hypothetical protein